MAYSEFLLKIGDFVFPHEYIRADSYKAYVNMQDIDDYTDANGYLHREAVDLKALKVEFETPPMMTNTQFSSLMASIQSQYTIPKAKQCVITAYIPEYDDYVTQTGYMVDIQPQIYGIFNGVIYYDAIRFAFVGGVYDG